MLCAATALMLFVAVLSYVKRQHPMARTMIAMMLTASCYALGYVFELMSDDYSGVRLSYHFEYLGIPFVSAFWLLLVFQFTGFASAYRKRIAIGLFLIPAATFVLQLTNDWHHLLYKEFIPHSSGAIPLYITVKGPWYIVHAVYNYTILLFGILLFLPMFMRAVPMVRKQIVVLIVGALGPLLLNMAYMVNKEVDFTPIGFALSGLVYAWGIFRFRLLRLTPLAYAKMFDTIRDAVILLDYDDQIVSRNGAAVDVYPELAVLSDTPLTSRELFSSTPELLARVEQTTFQDARFPLERALHGRVRHYLCSLTHIYDSGTVPIGKLIMLSEVTELKESEERLREQSQQLTQLNAFKDKLFTVMAHDIRDPIALLVSLTELLEGDETGATKREVLPEIKRQVKGTYDLVDNLLDWYRSQNGRVAFRPLSWSLHQVVRQAIRLAGARAAMKQIALLELVEETVTVEADKEMLDSILRNLLANAIKHTDIGGMIEVGATLEGGRVTVSVSDNGSGIDEGTVGLLRHDEMYFKEPAFASGEDGGKMRFGLVLAREFVRMHGGRLWFESAAGQGTTFYFTLAGSLTGEPATAREAGDEYESDAG